MSLELLEKAKADRAWLMDCMSDYQEERFREWLMLRTRILSDYEDTCWSLGMEKIPTKRIVNHPVAVSLALGPHDLSYDERLDVEIEETCLQNRFLLFLFLSIKGQK